MKKSVVRCLPSVACCSAAATVAPVGTACVFPQNDAGAKLLKPSSPVLAAPGCDDTPNPGTCTMEVQPGDCETGCSCDCR